MSVRRVNGCPATCSGEAYSLVMKPAPGTSRLCPACTCPAVSPRGARALARPKSFTLAITLCPETGEGSGDIITLSGLTSWWMSPRSWA